MSEKKQKTAAAKALKLVKSDGHITVTNGQIWGAKDSLRTLLMKEWPVRTSFHLAKLTNTLNGHLQNINSVRDELIKKHGTPMEEKPGNFQVTDTSPGAKEYQRELNELMSIEVDVAVSVVVLPSEVNGMEVQVVAGDLFNLTPFITMEAEDA